MKSIARLSRFLKSAQYTVGTHTNEQPIRSELFSTERLQEHAASLASNQVIAAHPGKDNILAKRTAENEKKLLKCYNAATRETLQRRSITPAAEWLLDNYRVIEEQFREVHQGLQAPSYIGLPRLAQGPLAGNPHIYGVIWAFVAHTDSRFDAGLLKCFLDTYQKTQPLSIAELWSIPITLRCVMIENLRRVSVNVAARQAIRYRADKFANDLLQLDKLEPQNINSVLRELTSKPIAPSFAVQLIQRLRYQDISMHWLDQDLTRQGMSSDALVQMEHATQAADNMTVRNIITSLREMWAFDWQTFFEEVSLVEELLRRQPSYADMDFPTRNRYRHAVEILAKNSPHTELEITQAVLDKTVKGKIEFPDDERRWDSGYYLLALGRREFEQEIGYRPTFGQRCLRIYTYRPTAAYMGTIFLLTAFLLAIPLWFSYVEGVSLVGLFLLGLAGSVPASDLAALLINKAIAKMVPARYLLRLELKQGVPPDMKTFVVVPTMLTSESTISTQIEQLQVHYLANPEDNVRFALLTDWSDSDTETREEDAPLLSAAAKQIAALNTLYGSASNGEPHFFLFHRKRLWNEAQKKWISWERKRGKLHEFNRMLRGADDTSYITISGKKPQVPGGIRFVITLDSDTRLPIGAVRQLVGTAAHPQNCPRLHPETQQIVEGYGILQPRITPMLPNNRDTSVFQRIFSGPSGIDPYAGAVSNIYQDLFGAGSYTGKGIYNVDAFEASLAGRIPENTVLSHDLFEGIFARCGLITDVELFEDFPSNYQVAASRTHRWIRGDWQLLPWILGFTKQPIPAIDRWKMLDNLRRSFSSPAMVLTLLATWTVPNAPVAIWTAYVLLALAAPAILTILHGLLPVHRDISLASHVRAVSNDLLYGVGQTAVMLTLLAHQSALALDAISRTLFRLLVSHRLLLEWVTAAQAKRRAAVSLKSFTWSLRGGIILAVLLFFIVAWINPDNLYPAAPFLILWSLASIFARLISLPPEKVLYEETSAADKLALRLEGRRIWRFFTTFVNAEDNFLPPDNFQEDPDPVIAHRSSPTNLGLYLLSALSARDFGWIGRIELAERLEATLGTMQKLPRFQGHFFNWYDTQTLETLKPQYISTVDSGNLAGHLLALESGCHEMRLKPVFTAMDLAGVADSLRLLRNAIKSAKDDRRTSTVNLSQLSKGLEDFEPCLLDTPRNAQDWAKRWVELNKRAVTLLDLAHTFAQERGDADHSEVYAWAQAVHADVASHLRDLPLAGSDPRMPGSDSEYSSGSPLQLDDRLEALGKTARRLFQEMQFGFLYSQARQLFAIGYRVQEDELDNSYYDLLASEARVASFIAIAKGDIPSVHWFRLGRPLTSIDGGAVLMSWSGSMFEYLMPSLIMFTPRHSVLGYSCRLAVKHQIEYGRERRLPWGVSESAYNIRDRALTYQYSDFGVPGLGLKRGLTQNLVVAPYATLLAAMYDAPASAENLMQIEAAGGRGTFGFYDAIDYTLQRLPEGQKSTPVRVYMAHHQGMSLIAIGNALFTGVMRHRFHQQPIVRAADLLLQEPQPREAGIARSGPDVIDVAQARKNVQSTSRRFHSAKQSVPSTLLLSNGSYSLMLTTAGSGYSNWNGLAIYRWREDLVCDARGSYVYLRDTANGEVWSATLQPVGAEPDRYEVVFSEDRARINRKDGSLSSNLEIIVSPEDNAEIRRLSITNSGAQPREVELTSYAELVLAPKAADTAHPAFSNLFIQTEFLPQIHGLIAKRRPRAAQEQPVWAAHMISGGTLGETLEYETDRARFLGRGRTVHDPIAILDGRPLSNTDGAVLDPVFSLRTRVKLAPGATKHVMFVTMVGASREEIVSLADKYQDPSSFDRISTQAWTQSQVGLHHLGISADEANLFQYLASRVLFADPAMRPSTDTLKNNKLNATSLWRYSISGTLPIILVRIEDQEDREIVRQLLRAHEYLRSKNLSVDLIILNERKASYIQDLQDSVENMVKGSQIASSSDPAKGDIFVLRADLLEPAEMELLQCVARVTLNGVKQGSLEEQVIRMRRTEAKPTTAAAQHMQPIPAQADESMPPSPPMEFFNGLGGFTKQGQEYVTVLGRDQRTPAPWINIIANPNFGFLVSASGAGYTWASNSQSNQLSVWSNDPVSDPPSEVFYLRDEENGALWTPTALPIRLEHTRYITYHGYGYSRFEHHANDISSTLQQFVSWNDPIKVSTLTLTNTSSRHRKLTATAYIEWVLGESRQVNAPFIITEIDPSTGAMFASNSWNPDFGECIAFADWSGRAIRWTGDRSEFIGRNGNLRQPAALMPKKALSNRTGAGLDPCSALQTAIELAPGQQLQLTFLMGQTESRSTAAQLVQRYRNTAPSQILSEVTDHWAETLNTLQVETPDLSMDIILNGWLLYQVLACRMWARTGFYQASGAYGFRDQLQDSMALNLARPDITRAHLLRSAARQFAEGDVQHWWHLPTGRGVRTHITDDRLWLPYAVAEYISVTGNMEILDEEVPFLEGAAVAAGEESAYYVPTVSATASSLYDHCVRAIDCSLTAGRNGLPLMGGGDWNDGMNRVGHEGKGESVWLGWFICATITKFSDLARIRGDQAHIDNWKAYTSALQKALEKNAWDGAWYRRAYFDDGRALGSAANMECRIDSIAQSWSVISGVADPARQQRAMESVEQYLIRHGDSQTLLFTPPFDKTTRDPGYIKGYLPGVRENGGQYTHAAVWCMIAYTVLGDGNRAGEMFKMLNPINHASTRAGVHVYKVEPYVVSADIYASPSHLRRGGWTWYTGSAAWLYRAGVESMLGFQKLGDELLITPCIPQDWRNYRVTYQHGAKTRYVIAVENPQGVACGVAGVEVDGKALAGSLLIPLVDDGLTHRVRVIMGKTAPQEP